jgi:hypothetical protein
VPKKELEWDNSIWKKHNKIKELGYRIFNLFFDFRYFILEDSPPCEDFWSFLLT